MKNILVFIAWCTVFLFSCNSKNQVYSTRSLDRAYKYDSYWDYRGYSPHENVDSYRTYDPDRRDDIIESLKQKGEKL